MAMRPINLVRADTMPLVMQATWEGCLWAIECIDNHFSPEGRALGRRARALVQGGM
jgi:hypothetical protein